MAEPVTIVLAGGGTGGHLFPGLAVGAALLDRRPELRLVLAGSDRSHEAEWTARTGWPHVALTTSSLSDLRRKPWTFAKRNWRAWCQARAFLRSERPACVVGLGGFSGAPLVAAALWARHPVVLLEQNVLPGRATRWLSRGSCAVCLSFAESARHFSRPERLHVTGNPVRAPFLTARDARAASRHLVILGGSQGADSLNRRVSTALCSLKETLAGWTIFHQTGPRMAETLPKMYRAAGLDVDVAAFVEDLSPQLARAAFVVSRAGATSLAELACLGVPAVLVPYPHAAEDHQRWNAEWYGQRGAAAMVLETATIETELRATLQQWITDDPLRQRHARAMAALGQPDAAGRVADCVLHAIATSDQQQAKLRQ